VVWLLAWVEVEGQEFNLRLHSVVRETWEDLVGKGWAIEDFLLRKLSLGGTAKP